MVLVQKWPFLQLFFFLGNIGQKNVFYDILEWKNINIRQENFFYDILGRKNAFLGYKNKESEKWKNWHFSKGVNQWFWSKNGYFSNFCFYEI